MCFAGSVGVMADAIDQDFSPGPLRSRHRFWSSRSMVHGSPRQCPSLESLRERLVAGHGELTARLDFESLSKLSPFTLRDDEYASHEWGRVCRTCCWEPVLSFLLAGEPSVAVTFSSAAASSDPSKYRPSVRADARLARIVGSCPSLQVAPSSMGAVAFGRVSPVVVSFLESNNLLVVRSGVDEIPARVVGLAWDLWRSEPYEDFGKHLEYASAVFFTPGAVAPTSAEPDRAKPSPPVRSMDLF